MNIVELAKQANGEPAWSGGVEWHWDELQKFAALVAAHEREACAKLCDALHYEVDAYGAQCAVAIRARGRA